jgi:iron complex outermembrane receptor protein
MSFKIIKQIMLATASIGAAAAAPAWAQTPSDSEAISPQEIVVTARKREERLLDVPVPITALSPQQIQDTRLSDARDLLLQVPSAFLQENNAGTSRDISIRGVGTPTLFAEPGVALYIDEVYSSGFISYPTQFFDLERIEVLRGPQGALYGRNAVGGAVNIVSARPTDTFEAMARATYARYDRYELEGMVNVPISDALGVRLSGVYFDQNKGEYFNSALGQYIDKSDSFSGRAVVRLRPSDAFTLDVVYEHNHANTPGTNLFFPNGGETPKTILRDTQPVNNYNVDRLSLNASLKTDNAGTFTLVVGGRDYTLGGIEDTDLSDILIPGAPNAPNGQMITTRANSIRSRFGEARWLSPELGPVTLLAGITYLDEDALGALLTDLPGLSLAFTGGTLPVTLGIDNDQGVKSWAGYVEANAKLSSELTLAASLRYTEDKKRVDFLFTPSAVAAAVVGPSQSASVKRTFDNWSPGVSLAWVRGNVNIYGRVQTGFRAGGFNFNVAQAANLPYSSEKSINYEIGSKFAFADGRAFVGVSAYILEQKDVLVSFFDFTAPPGLNGYLANAGKARTYGAELEGTFKPAKGISLGATLGYTDAQFTSGLSGTGAPLDGQQVPGTRKWSFGVNGSVDQPLSEAVSLLANAAFAHRDGGFQEASNTFTFGNVDLLNLSAGLKFGNFDVMAYAQNLLNDRYDIASGGNRPVGGSGILRAPGVTYGLSVRARF